MRRAAKRDLTEDAIVDAAHALGCKVQYLSQGGGVPDLLIKTPRGRWLVVEVKSPGGKLTPEQIKWHRYYGPVPVVETPDELVAIVAGV